MSKSRIAAIAVSASLTAAVLLASARRGIVIDAQAATPTPTASASATPTPTATPTPLAKAKFLSEKIAGALTPVTTGVDSRGACSSLNEYDAICPSGHCSCDAIGASAGAAAAGNLLGKGTVAISLTLDDQIGTESEGTTPPVGCQPVFGRLVTAASGTPTTTLGRGKNAQPVNDVVNISATYCPDVLAGGKSTLNGGFGIASSTVGTTASYSGSGTMAGTIDPSGNAVLILHGPITVK
jgi:hypothetical protein